MYQELHILEEETNLFWGLIILVCTASGTYVLAGAFADWNLFGFDQMLALGLFLISFWGIFKLSEPLYLFIFTFERDDLLIEIKKGEIEIDRFKINVHDIKEMRYSSHFPRSSGEALFDFSTSYHLLWRKHGEQDFQKMLNLKNDHFTLKVEDIAKIMRFIKRKNSEIIIPEEQAAFFNL